MRNTVEKVIEMPQIASEQNNYQITVIIYELINMIFEMFISFVPIVLYWLVFYFSDIKVDYYEHIKNGSIIWIFLAMLVAGNFKILVNGQHRSGLAQRLIVACILIFMLVLLGVYLILNFTAYGFIKISLAQENTTGLVVLLGISTVVINVLRIVFFNNV